MKRLNPLLAICFIKALILPCPVFSQEPAGLTERRQLDMGRAIYQQGIGADGEPVAAFVMGDVEVTGAQFTCLNCHRRSGLGGPEGTKFVLPTNGRSLAEPRIDMYMARPAYTPETFADALLRGVNPKGMEFDRVMPIYDLSEQEIEALFVYLQTVSDDYSPGVDDSVIHLATVVSHDVDPAERDAMLRVIETYIAHKNAQTRNEIRRLESGPFYHEYRNKAYRTWVLHLWELNGPAATWPAQLQEYYRRQPVFALLSGMVSGSWQPIHDFCEVNRIPCLLPNTDLPGNRSGHDYYTVYYSEGLRLEARVALTALRETESSPRLLQIYRPETEGQSAAELLQDSDTAKGLSVGNLEFDPEQEFPVEMLRRLQLAADRGEPVFLWLDEADLRSFARLISAIPAGLRFLISSSLLGGNTEQVPESLKDASHIIHPFVIPEEQDRRFLLFEGWLRGNKIALTSPRIQGQTYFACFLLNSGFTHIKRYFYRDYLLDLLDHGDRMGQYSGNYPRLSFGPEQRFLAKGAYLINLKTMKAKWVVPF